MSAFVQTCDRFLARLSENGFGSRVIGAAALAAHGVSRATRDLDLLVADRRVLSLSWDGVPEEGVELVVHRGDPTDPLDGVIRVQEVLPDDAPWEEEAEQLDVVVLRPLWAREMLGRSGPPVAVGSGTVPSVEEADLVVLKLYAGGPRDHWDVASLLQVTSDREALVARVDERVAAMGREVRERWQTLRSQ